MSSTPRRSGCATSTRWASTLRRLEGIGPFWSELVTVRTLGHTDVLPTTSPAWSPPPPSRLGRDRLSVADFAEVAEAWRPWRTWACVALRAAA